jgi:hypothetical protein
MLKVTWPECGHALLSHVYESQCSYFGYMMRLGLTVFTQLSQQVRVLACIPEVPGFNLGRFTGYPDWGFSWFSSVIPVNAGVVPQTLPRPLFSRPFQLFTNHPAIWYYIGLSWVTVIVVEQTIALINYAQRKIYLFTFSFYFSRFLWVQ